MMTRSVMVRWAWRITGILLLLPWGVAPVQAREKTDIVVLANGTPLQVEIDSLDRGLLKAKTNEMGTLHIECDEVVAVSSNFVYDLTDKDGQKYVGTLEEGPEEGTLVVRSEEGAVTLELPDVVQVKAELSQLSADVRSIHGAFKSFSDVTTKTLVPLLGMVFKFGKKDKD